VLHGVKVGAAAIGDLDHVLIGPPGIVIINAKQLKPQWPVTISEGEIYSGSYRLTYLREAVRDQRRASWLINSALEAIVARKARRDLPDAWSFSPDERAVEKLAARGGTREVGSGWPPVVSAVVLVGAGSVDEQPSPVLVCRASSLCQRLRERPSVLSGPQVQVLYEVAHRSTTWSRDTRST
jgi:hypothetical protein